MWVVVGIFVLVILIPMLATHVLYRGSFGRRYEPEASLDYKLHHFEHLERKSYPFVAKGGYKLQGYYYKLAQTTNYPKGVIILAHGFGLGGHTTYMPEINELVKGGYDVFAYDATGNGESEGKVVGGLTQGVLDVRAAFDFVYDNHIADDVPIFLYGHSWGAYSVMAVLNTLPDIKGVVAISGFNKVEDAIVYRGRAMYGSLVSTLIPYLKVYNKLKYGEVGTCTSLEGLQKAKKPVLILHSKEDHMVDFSKSYQLFQAQLKEQDYVQFLAFEDRKHEPVRTMEVQQHLSAIQKEYQRLKDVYGSKDRVPNVLLETFYEKNLETYRQLDSEVMATIITFYDTISMK